MVDKVWKTCERRLAHAFGLVRNGGGSGRSAGRVGDTRRISDTQAADLGLSHPYGPPITFEAKWRGLSSKNGDAKRFFAYKELDKLRTDLKNTGDIPAVALFEKNRPGFVICVHSRDLIDFALLVLKWYIPNAISPWRKWTRSSEIQVPEGPIVTERKD